MDELFRFFVKEIRFIRNLSPKTISTYEQSWKVYRRYSSDINHWSSVIGHFSFIIYHLTTECVFRQVQGSVAMRFAPCLAQGGWVRFTWPTILNSAAK
jgi:hypothetical protein